MHLIVEPTDKRRHGLGSPTFRVVPVKQDKENKENGKSQKCRK